MVLSKEDFLLNNYDNLTGKEFNDLVINDKNINISYLKYKCYNLLETKLPNIKALEIKAKLDTYEKLRLDNHFNTVRLYLKYYNKINKI